MASLPNRIFIANLLLLSIIISSCATPFPSPAGYRKVAAVSGPTWSFSGYLADEPGKKIYVTISGDRIKEVSATKPQGANVFETDNTIFPGFVDMHSHVKYNVLPLWDLARGQFLNRFEWRSKFAPYKDAVSANMKGVKGDTVCAAVRWAELKALTGGATAIQGIGGDSKCAKGFGVSNLEIPEDFAGNKIRAMTDMVMPDLVGKVFTKFIEPEMAKGKSYDDAFKKMLEDQKVTAWINYFVKETHSVPNAFKLLIGTDFGLDPTLMSEAEFSKAESRIRQYLSGEPFKAKDKDIDKQIAAMKKWIFGDATGGGYLKSKKDDKTAFDFLSKGGVLTVPSSIRRYIGMFESSVRQSALQYFANSGPKALIAHVAEGMRKDAYNRLEYQYAKKFGLNREGLVMIHAVGLDSSDFSDAARNRISIVWSPFSNLLLYGETLDVAAAKTAGVNITLGADWSPTGSKNILDELKIARRYLDKFGIKQISNKDLIQMVTTNAAKALDLEKEMGQVKPGYLANMTVLKCRAGQDPYECAVRASQKEVNLVVVNGQALYGEPDIIKSIARIFNDDQEPESLPRSTPRNKDCDFRKAVRFMPVNEYDRAIKAKGLNLRSVADIENHLDGALLKSESKKQKATLDQIFSCGDDKYTRRFNEFVEKEIEFNARNRDSGRRGEYNLDDKWTPFTLTGEEESDDDH